MHRFFKQITPFLMLGVALAMLAVAAVIFFYLFLAAVIVGGAIALAVWVHHKWLLFKTKAPSPKKKGRIIESNDWRKL